MYLERRVPEFPSRIPRLNTRVRYPKHGYNSLNAIKRSLSELRGDGRGTVLAATAAGWSLSMGVRMVYPVLLPQIRAAYDLDLTSAGLLLTVLFVLYGLGQWPGGLLADRLGERVILTGSTIVAALTLLIVVGANSRLMLFTATALFGLSLSFYAVARYTVLAGIFPDQIGTANGLVSAASDAGQSAIPPIAGVIAGFAAWEFGLAFSIPFFLLVAWILWIVIPDESETVEGPSSEDSLTALQSFKQVFRRPAIGKGALVLILTMSIWQAFTGFYPTYLIEIKGLSPLRASILFGLFFALGIFIQPLSGFAYDSFGIRKTLTAFLGVFTAAMVVLPMANRVWVLLAITVGAATLLGVPTTIQSHLLVLLPEDGQGSGLGLLRTISFTIGAASPVVFGALGDNGLFNEGFIGFGVLAVVLILVVQRL